MGLTATKMLDVTDHAEDLRAQVEAKRKDIEAKELKLQAQLEKERKSLEKKEIALKEAQWQEKLEVAEKEIGPLYRSQRQKEKKISGAMNDLFQEASKRVEAINALFGELETLKKEISQIEDSMVRKEGGHDLQAKDALEFKKVEIDREIKVPQQSKGAFSVVKEVNRIKGFQGSLSDMLVGRKADTLSSYARNIFTELMENRARIIKNKEDAMVKLAGIAEPRIVKAREELEKCLEELEEENLISYEKDGVDYVIRGTG